VQVAEGEGEGGGVGGAVAVADPGEGVGAEGARDAEVFVGGGDDGVADCEAGPRDEGALALGVVE